MNKFEEWFDSEYSNFGRKASTFYSADHDFYTSQFIDERYDAYQAGQQSRQAEINQLQSQINEMAEVGLSQESVIKEKDKRIESALSELESLHNKKWAEWKEQADMHSQGEANAYEHAMQILEKVLGGEHE